MPTTEPSAPPKAAASLRDFSAKPRSADLPAPQPEHPYDAKAFARTRHLQFPDDFCQLVNPTDRTVTARLYLGPVAGQSFQPPRARAADDDDDDAPNPKQLAAAWNYQCSLFTKISFPPGEMVLVPCQLVSALVTVRDGEVIGGLCPMLRIPDDPNPPTLHPSLTIEVHESPFQVPTAKPRGNAKKGPA